LHNEPGQSHRHGDEPQPRFKPPAEVCDQPEQQRADAITEVTPESIDTDRRPAPAGAGNLSKITGMKMMLRAGTTRQKAADLANPCHSVKKHPEASMMVRRRIHGLACHELFIALKSVITELLLLAGRRVMQLIPLLDQPETRPKLDTQLHSVVLHDVEITAF